MKLVPSNINEAIKHLAPRSEEELNSNFNQQLLSSTDAKDIRTLLYFEFREKGIKVNWENLTDELYYAFNACISAEDRKRAIKKIVSEYK